MEDTEEKCGNCYFWEERRDGPYGKCRFDPPKVILTPDGILESRRPSTVDNAWCRRWKSKSVQLD